MTGGKGVMPWANGTLALLAMSALGSFGWIALTRKRGAAPITLPPSLARDRILRRAADQALARGDFAIAEREYRAALAYHPSRRELRLSRAQALVGLGRRREAWSLYGPIVKPCLSTLSDPMGGRDSLAWYADLEAEFGSPENADRAARRTSWRPSGSWPSGKPLLSLAHLWSAGRTPSPLALCHIRRAISLDPNSVAAHLALARCLVETSQKPEARGHIAHARRLADRGDGVGWMALADFYQDLKDEKAMSSSLERAFRRIARSNAQGWLAAHIVVKRMGDKKLADVALENARAAARPSDAATLCALAKHYDGRGDEAKALALAEAARKVMRPREGGRYGELALVFLNAHRKDEARTMLRSAIPYADERERASLDRFLAPLEGRKYPSGADGVGFVIGTGKPFAPYGFH